MTRSSAARLGWLFAAVLQIVLPAFASVADARVESASTRAATTHVEAPGTTKCPSVHPADCLVCQVLATRAAPAATPVFMVPVARVIDADVADAEQRIARARAPGDPPQRAPPIQA